MVAFAPPARFLGLGLALAALILETLRLRAPGTLPIARLVQRELRARLSWRDLVMCFAAGVLLVLVPVVCSTALGSAEPTRDPQWRSVSAVAVLGTVAVKLLWVAFEELAFRAALIRQLASRTGILVAVAVSAIAFAAAHGRDALSAAVLTVDGIAFGVAYVATGAIRAPIAWHFGKNLAVWVLTGQSTMQFASLPWRLSGTTATSPIDLVAAVVVAGLTSLLLLRKHHASRLDRTVLS